MVMKTLKSWLNTNTRKQPRRRTTLALALEHLEDRATPAAVSWDGGGGNADWFNALNWNNNALPTLSDTVTISGAATGVEINNTFGTATAGTLTSSSDLRVISGTLQLGGDSLVSGAFTLGGVTFGGVVNGTGTLTLAGNVTWGANGVMAGTGTTVMTGTSTLAGTTFGSIRENRTVENAGNATLLAANSFTFRDNAVFRNRAGGTFTIQSGAGIGTFFASATSKLVNEGTMNVNGPGSTTIGVPTENSGTLTSNAATLNLTGLTNSGTLETAGIVNTGSTFTNSGSIEIFSGDLIATAANGHNSGTVDIGPSGRWLLNGGTTFLDAGTVITGDGLMLMQGGNLTVTAPANVARLQQNSATATVNAPLTIGNYIFNGGTLTGTGKTTLTGASSFGGSGQVINAHTIDNASTLTWSGNGSIQLTNGSVLHNLTGAQFNIQAGVNISTFASGTNQVLNEGTMSVSGPGTTTFGVLTVNSGAITANGANLNLTGLTNSGTVNFTGGNLNTGANVNNSGTISVSGGGLTVGTGTSSGDIQLANGATMTLANTTFVPPFTLQDGATVTGGPIINNTFQQLATSGNVNVDAIQMGGGTLITPTGSNLTVGTLTLNGTVTVGGTITVEDNWAFTGGTVNGGGQLIIEGTSSFSGGFFSRVDNAAIVNSGSALIDTGASFTFSNNATWTNLSGSVFEVRGGSSLGTFFTAPTALFTNQGTILKTGTGTATIALPVVNQAGGTVRVTQGVLSLTGVLTNSGSIEILAGDLTTAANSHNSGTANIGASGRWLLNSGTTFFDAGATTTGAGVVLMQGGNLTVTGTANVARLQQNNATATVNAPLTIGDYIFSGGTLTGTGKTTLTGMSSFTGTAQRVITAHTIDNAGTVIWTDNGPIQFTNGAVFNNLAGSLFDVTGDGSIAPSPFGGLAPAFNNAGTLRKSGGSGPVLTGPRTTWNVPLTNSGTLDVRTGNFAVVIPTFGLPAGTPMLTNTGTIQVGTPSSSAAAIILPGTAPFPNPPAYTLTGGTLTGTGQVGGATNLTIAPSATLGGTLTVNGNVINRGTVQPGTSPGALAVTGNYTQVDDATADGRLVIGLRGDSASGLFGKLQVNGTSQLAGALQVFSDGGFLPDFGDVFQVFRTIGARTGDFTYPAGGYDLDGYRVLTPEYDGTGLRLNLVTEVGALPVIDPIPDFDVNEGQTVSFTATVSGAEPPGPLTFSLADGSSPGATIDPNTGEFTFFSPDGPNEYVFQIAVHDPNAPTDPVDVETFVVTVRNVAPAVTITGGQPALDEGDEFTASGSFTDPGADAWTATVDYGDGTGVQALTLNADKTFSLDHHYLDNGNFTVAVRIFDGFEYGTATFNVSVANLAPVVVAAADQTANEGAERTFDLGSFTDVGSTDQPWTVSVNWGDGSTPQVFETTQQGPLAPLAHTFADSGNYTVTVSVTDKDGATTSDTFTVQVANLAPVVSVSGPSSGIRGQARTFTLGATDVSPVDQAAGFTFTINWGDGTTQTVTGASGTTVEHIYTSTGNYTVTVTATDKDGGTSATVTSQVAVSVVGVQNGALVVGGTTGDDVIAVTPGLGSGSYIVTVLSPTPSGTELTIAIVSPNASGFDIDLTVGNAHIGLLTVPYAPPLSHVEVYAQDGDDIVTVSNGVGLASVLFGDDGDDWMKGGGGNSILDGGNGDDILFGGNGRDILVGGHGSDRLLGQNGDDILFGGVFLDAEPSQEARRTSLLSVAQTWGSSASFANRMSALSGYLAPRVGDDGVADYLTGGGGNDWYFAHTTGSASTRDVLTGVTPHDAVTTI